MLRTVLVLAAIAVLIQVRQVQCDDGNAANPQKPKEIVLPEFRDFRHPSKILTLSEGGETMLRMMSKADDNRMLFMTEFYLENFASKDKKPTVLESGAFRFRGQYESWTREIPKTIHILIDGADTTLECKSEGESGVIYAFFKFEDYVRILDAKLIQVKIASFEFDLEDRHLEALRDLGSRVPEGPSSKGNYVIIHKPDRVRDKPEGKVPNKFVAEAKKKRLAQISLSMKELPPLKAELKRATVAADDIGLKKASKSLETWRDYVQSLMENPLCEQNFNLEFKEGQILRIENPDLKILQVTDKAEGKAIVHHKFSSKFKAFYVVGMNLTNIVDGSAFPRGRNFVVRGTTTYATAGGGTNTVFELQDVTDDLAFTDAETIGAREAMQHALDVDLTNEEQEKIAATQRLKQKEMQEAKAAKEAEQAKKDADAKAQRAKSFLDLGKSLSSKGNASGARKQYEKAVAESPDSEAGKEAKSLLEVLPKK